MDGYFGGDLQVNAPLINLTKPEIWRLAISDGLPVDLIYSCQKGDDPPCGECPSCQDRRALYAYNEFM